jgi:hypothetical protein
MNGIENKITKAEYDRLLKKYIEEQAIAHPEKQPHGFLGKWAEYAVRKREFDILLRAGVITIE